MKHPDLEKSSFLGLFMIFSGLIVSGILFYIILGMKYSPGWYIFHGEVHIPKGLLIYTTMLYLIMASMPAVLMFKAGLQTLRKTE